MFLIFLPHMGQRCREECGTRIMLIDYTSLDQKLKQPTIIFSNTLQKTTTDLRPQGLFRVTPVTVGVLYCDPGWQIF